MTYTESTQLEQVFNAIEHHISIANIHDEHNEELVRLSAQITARAFAEVFAARNNQQTSNIENYNPFPIVFAEWAQQYGIKTHYDRFLAVMNFLREQKGVNHVDTNDIGKLYEKARWKKPANMADVFAKGAERILFAEAETVSEDGLKQWQMTRTGYNHLMSLKTEE